MGTATVVRGLYLRSLKSVLVKFMVKDRSLVPAGLRDVSRPSDKVMDKIHAEEVVKAGEPRLAMEGRVRPGRVDTGKPIYQNEEHVRAGFIRQGLVNNGLRLTDAHFFVKRAGKGGDQYVIVLSYNRSWGDLPVLSEETLEGIRRLVREFNYTAHVWDNPGGNATVNFTARQTGAFAQTLIVRDGVLTLESGDTE